MIDRYLAQVISFYDAMQLSLVKSTEQLVLQATPSGSWLKVAAADVLDALQTTSEVLDQFQLVLHVLIFVLFEAGDVEAKVGVRWETGGGLVVVDGAIFMPHLVQLVLQPTHLALVVRLYLILLPNLTSWYKSNTATTENMRTETL